MTASASVYTPVYQGQQPKAGWPNLAFCLFSYGPQAEWFWHFLWLGKKIKRRRILHNMWKLHKIPISVSINKVLLKFSHDHLLTSCLWLLLRYKGRVEWLQQGPQGPQNQKYRASLVAQWLRVCLPMQGTRVRALVWEDPTCRGAAGPVSHNYWACAPQQERPR